MCGDAHHSQDNLKPSYVELCVCPHRSPHRKDYLSIGEKGDKQVGDSLGDSEMTVTKKTDLLTGTQNVSTQWTTH